MPIYEYKCLACNVQFERLQGISAPTIEECPECNGKVKRLIGASTGSTLKGSGSDITDYQSKDYKEFENKDKNASPDKNVEATEVQRLKSNFSTQLASIRVPWMFDRSNSEHIIISVPSNAITDVVPKVSGMIARILATYPPGMVQFLLIDPVGLGQNFASFHALADYDEKLVTNRVWSDRRHIRERLEEIIAHIEGVVQTYLRSDFESIDQYNEQAGEIAEAYRFIFIYDFPENFDSETCLALERILVNGARCGIHVVMVWDESKELPHGVKPEQIIQRTNHYKTNGNALELVGLESKERFLTRFILDASPEESIVSQIVKNHGESAAEGAVVEVPYEKFDASHHGR